MRGVCFPVEWKCRHVIDRPMCAEAGVIEAGINLQKHALPAPVWTAEGPPSLSVRGPVAWTRTLERN
jgi:hypothetical protein